MKYKTLYIATVAALLTPVAHAADNLTDAITGGKVSGDFRVRYESVNQDNALHNANATTLRSRLGYMTGDYLKTSAFLEFENISAMNDNYAPESPGYSTVADPTLTQVNQAFLAFKAIENTQIKFGRQRVIYDNHRFIGNVGWRQNEQTFDSVTLNSKLGSMATLNYGYVWKQQDIVGAATDMSTHLVNLALKDVGPGTLTAYGYLIGYEAAAAKANSQKTLGLRYAGKADAIKLNYTLEYAKQSAYQDGNSNIDAKYLLAELGTNLSGVDLKAGYELLGADNYSGFETPLATKHSFNGWADVFLNTPKNGLKDLYLSVGGKVADTRLVAMYHKYSEDKGGLDLGNEINLLATKSYGKNYSVTAKYANYRKGASTSPQVDTRKFWLMGEIKF